MKESKRFMQRASDMEHIAITDLCAHLDEMLERCNKENIGFVIDDEHTSYVLCPAWWVAPCWDDDFGLIVNSALRYSIGRSTYMPSVVTGFIQRYLDFFDVKTLSNIIEDIEQELLYNTNIEDLQMWKGLQQDCEQALEHLLVGKTGNK